MVFDYIPKSVDIQKLFISGIKLIKKYNKIFKDQFYIPPFEQRKDGKTGINWDLVDDGNYVKSKDKIGEISDIAIAVCESAVFWRQRQQKSHL